MANRLLTILLLTSYSVHMLVQATTPASYDYVVVGGGTAGSVLANRLSEEPSVTVAVIEAGGWALHDPLVEDIYGGCLACGTQVDWNYTSMPQAFANNTVGQYHAGRCLGGSSAINGEIYLRPSAQELDTWPALGNTGWNWSSLLPYFRKSEHLQIPTESQIAQGVTYIPTAHGFDGPLDVGWAHTLDIETYGHALNGSWQTLGLTWNLDPNAGSPKGLFLHPSEYDVERVVREDASRAYYLPAANRSNLHTFLYRTATKVIFAKDAPRYGNAIAQGVEVLTSDGEQETIYARREVILSTGTYRTPVLLESSGIGNSKILANLSVPVQIDLPGVGMHMQDQSINVFVFNTTVIGTGNISTDLTNMPIYAYVTAEDIFGNTTASVARLVQAKLPSYAQRLAAASLGARTYEAELELLEMRMDLIFNKGAPLGEFVFAPEFAACLVTLPFSVGTVHSSTAGASHPLINPDIFSLDIDWHIQAKLGELTRNLYAASPLSNYTISEVLPGLSVVPINATDEQWRDYFAASWAPVWHGVGTAPMMKKEFGGVLDENMIVYGSSNLRVVDASAIPFEVNGHPTSLIYAMAEKASDLIKAKWAGSRPWDGRR